MKILDYIYYRIFSFFKKAGDKAPEAKGYFILAAALSLTLGSALVIASIIKKQEFNVNKWLFAIPYIILAFLLQKKYDNQEKLEELEDRYKDEKLINKKLNGFFTALYLVGVLLIPILYGVLKHNLHMDI